MKQTIFFITLFIALGLMSCKKDKTENPIEFKFQLLDTLGNEKTVFNEGENIVFSFQIINNTSENLMLENFFPNDDLFRLFKLNMSEVIVNVGIPYEAYVKVDKFSILEGDTLKINYPWYNNRIWKPEYSILSGGKLNPRLSSGSYMTSFSQSFSFSFDGEILKTETKYFKIQFLIK